MNAAASRKHGAADDADDDADEAPVQRPRVARLLRTFAVPVVLIWVAAGALTNLLLPSLETTTEANAQALVPRDAPSSQAAIIQGKAFEESDYTSAAAILLETRGRKLGEQDHRYYDELVRRLLDDRKHVQSLMDLWGDPVTMSGQQSADAEAATVTVRPTGDLGDAQSNQSIDAIRGIVADLPPPEGAGIQTGLIRTMAGSGNVVVTAALVLAGTMVALLSSDVVNIGQAGSTIAIGLIVDMLVVRLLLVMPLARLLGPWFWWPQHVAKRPGNEIAQRAAEGA